MSHDYLAPNVRDALELAEATLTRLGRHYPRFPPETGGTLRAVRAAKLANTELGRDVAAFFELSAGADYLDTGDALDLLARVYEHLTGLSAAPPYAPRTEADPDELLDRQNDHDADGGSV